MHSVIPQELLSSAAQMLIYFFTVVAGLVSFMMTTRA
jgi:hypothetical protein